MASKSQFVGLGFVATSGAANQCRSATRKLFRPSAQTSASARTPWPAVPFITEKIGPAGQGLERSFFDVPAQDYAQGSRTRYVMFVACMSELQRTGNAGLMSLLQAEAARRAEKNKAFGQRMLAARRAKRAAVVVEGGAK